MFLKTIYGKSNSIESRASLRTTKTIESNCAEKLKSGRKFRKKKKITLGNWGGIVIAIKPGALFGSRLILVVTDSPVSCQ